MAARKWLKYGAGLLVFVLIAYFLWTNLYPSRQILRQSLAGMNFLIAAMLFPVCALYFHLGVAGWRYILKMLGTSISWRKAYWTTAGAHLVKYVPGHVWVLGGRVWLCNREGIPDSVSGTGIVIEILTQLATSTLLFLLCLPFFYRSLPLLYFVGAVVLFLSLMLAAHPRVLSAVWKFVPRFGTAVAGRTTYRYRSVFILVGIYLVAWLLQGLGVFVIAKAIDAGLNFAAALPIIGSYGGAYAVGFLSFITPSGLGVREGILSFLLKFFMPLPQAIVVAVMSRVMFTLVDIGVTAAVYIDPTFRRIARETQET